MTSPTRRRLRAPQADGAALIDPPLSEASALIAYNRKVGEAFDQNTGFPTGFRAAARRAVEAVACESTSRPSEGTAAPRIYSGHQPELFHPGVWLKNFVISAIAESLHGKAINLVVDSDTIRAPGIRVPTGTPSSPRAELIPFDTDRGQEPWERREILDEGSFASFSKRVAQAFHSFRGAQPKRLIVESLWPLTLDFLDRQKSAWVRSVHEIEGLECTPAEFLASVPAHGYLAECLAGGRHAYERTLGLQTCEFPLKLFSHADTFLPFADHLLARHRELHEIYNAALHDYRLVNHIRSHSHPVPDLERDGEWYEVPFWSIQWRPRRRCRVFAREVAGDWEITDREGMTFRPSAAARSQPHSLSVELLTYWAALRPRALITTMYARLVLSDLFIHGIGGAKYDELTDEIIRRFFGIEPPKYITATATFRLPIDRPHVTADDLRASARTLRDVRYRPEALRSHPLVRGDANLHAQLEAYAAEKREYLARHNPRRAPEEIFAGLDRLNGAMHALLAPVERELHAAHARLIDDARKSALLGSREFSFVLFSEELPARLLALCQGVA